MLLFWRNGYRGVSIDDLTEAMDITKPSLYAAFGDKEALFLSAIDYYRDKVMAPQFHLLMESQSLRVGLTEFFDALSKLITNKETPGCFIACMLSQESCESEAIKAKLGSLIDGADAGFTKLFSTHRQQLRDGFEPPATARLLTSVLHGIAIRARAGASAPELAKIGKTFVHTVCK